MINIWEKIFRKKKWGEYPPEDLIRFIKREKLKRKSKIKLLELGCGPGANTKFFLKERIFCCGIDISKTAIKKNILITKKKSCYKVGDFEKIPWKKKSFDIVVDNFSIYANKYEKISKIYHEVHRVLKNGGVFFSKMWGTKTYGFNTGKKIERNTFDKIKVGPCKNMGISHFTNLDELKNLNKIFNDYTIDKTTYTDKHISNKFFVEIFISKCKKL